MNTNIRQELKTFISHKFMTDNIAEQLNYDTLLLDQHVIDSSGVLILIMHVEKLFKIRIDDNELIPEKFNSINLLAALIQKKLGTTPVGVEASS